MKTVKVCELRGVALDWAVAKCEGYTDLRKNPHRFANDMLVMTVPRVEFGVEYLCDLDYSTSWELSGPIIERENITLIRANSQYVEDKYVPLWFAETDKWVGHNIKTRYEGEDFDPCFMVDEAGGCYGTTPLIAAMRCYVARNLGDDVEIPEELSE